MKKWRCTVCDYIHEGDEPPDKCPVCGADKSKFEEVSDEEATAIQAAKTDKQLAREKKMLAGSGAAGNAASSGAAGPASAAGGAEPQEGSAGWIDAVHGLMTKHHAHPISTHFPNGVLPVSLLFVLLALGWSAETLEKAAFYNSLVVLVSLPVVLYTGINAWRRKYGGNLTPIFRTKIIAAAVVAVACLLVVLWHLAEPALLVTGSGLQQAGFVLLYLILVAAVSVAGFIGGKLVFKD